MWPSAPALPAHPLKPPRFGEGADGCPRGRALDRTTDLSHEHPSCADLLRRFLTRPQACPTTETTSASSRVHNSAGGSCPDRRDDSSPTNTRRWGLSCAISLSCLDFSGEALAPENRNDQEPTHDRRGVGRLWRLDTSTGAPLSTRGQVAAHQAGPTTGVVPGRHQRPHRGLLAARGPLAAS